MANAIPCDNCTAPAEFIQGGPGVSPAHWCATHLPAFLVADAQQGLLTAIAPEPEEPPAKASKSEDAPASA